MGGVKFPFQMLFKIISTYFMEAALNNFTSINYYDLIINFNSLFHFFVVSLCVIVIGIY